MMTDTAEAWTQNVTGLEGKISTPETMGFSQEIFGVFRFFDFPQKNIQ
jgi:hypothetical protein